MVCDVQEAKTQVSLHLVLCIYQVGQHGVETEQSERAHSKRDRTLSPTGKSWGRSRPWAQNTVERDDFCGLKCPMEREVSHGDTEQERSMLSVFQRGGYRNIYSYV